MGLCDDLVLKNDPPNKDFPISLVRHPVKQSLKKQLSLQAHHRWHCAGRSSGSTQLAACREIGGSSTFPQPFAITQCVVRPPKIHLQSFLLGQ